jgi:hypothetical protein
MASSTNVRSVQRTFVGFPSASVVVAVRTVSEDAVRMVRVAYGQLESLARIGTLNIVGIREGLAFNFMGVSLTESVL